MFAKPGIIWITFAWLVCFQSDACTHAARVAAIPRQAASSTTDSTQAARRFVQRFYDWYTPLAVSNDSLPAWYRVLNNADRYLDRNLAAAIRGDSVARQLSDSAARETLDFDPFLASQDPCEPYEVADVARRGDTFRVGLRPCHANGIGPVDKRPATC